MHSIVADSRQEPQIRRLTPKDASYPELLRESPDPPAELFVRGKTDALRRPQLAIVGSRNGTPGGRESAFNVAVFLARHGIGVTSGLAQGIDAAAHEGCLAGGGVTVAVFGTGLDRVFPTRHRELAGRISASGALVSEYPVSTVPRRGNFPRRNRIIAALSVGTLVVEAGIRSGALITARLAGEAGREVFAVPGSIHNPVARGCHRLIRDDAKLVETGEDILEELTGILGHIRPVDAPPDAGDGAAEMQTNSDPQASRLLQIMGFDTVTVDILVNRSGLTAEEVSSMLLTLELQGIVQLLTGGRYQRVAPGQREEVNPG